MMTQPISEWGSAFRRLAWPERHLFVRDPATKWSGILRSDLTKKALNALVKEDSTIGPLVQRIMGIMKSGEAWVDNCCFQLRQEDRYSVTYLYYFVLRERPPLAPKGYWKFVQEKLGWPVPPQSN
jgi:hypothetical protein